MKYTEEQIKEIITFAFRSGENWGVCYSGWFSPSEESTNEKISDAIDAVLSGNMGMYKDII